MGKKYLNPPITEALCQLQFDPNTEWDITVPGLLYERVKDRFPKRRQLQELDIMIDPKLGLSQEVSRHTKPANRIQFWTEDAKTLIQVGPNLLVTNHLKPYTSWQEFLPNIKQGFEAYTSTTSAKVVQRAALRYINQIEFTETSIDLEHYFNYYPFIGKELPQLLGEFNIHIQIPYDNESNMTNLRLANAGNNKTDNLVITLDLDYSTNEEAGLNVDDMYMWLNIAHDRLKELFEACITNKTRNMLGEAQE